MPDRNVDHLIIGAGIAAGSCARQLRASGGDGSILLVGREPDPPYDRPPLSKGYLQGSEERGGGYLESAAWYADNGIELLVRTSVTGLDLAARSATLSDGREIGFGQALLATGANVTRLAVDGAELDGIHYLRTYANADAIRADAAGRDVVLIGGSYLACEVAATLTALGSRCTMVFPEERPLVRTFGQAAGRYFAKVLSDQGVRLRSGDCLERFAGAAGRVREVVTQGGLAIEADAVVVGAGVRPDVSLARRAGLEIAEGGGVLCDSQLRTRAPGVYAAGDIADYVSVVNGGRRQRVEHWDVALTMGRTVARNMLGADSDHDVVPYFFSDLADWASLESVGPAYAWDREVVRGSIDDGAFSIWYVDGGVLQGALAVGRSEDLPAARRLIAEQTALDDAAIAALADLDADPESIGV